VSPATLRLYEHTIGRFLRWVRSEHPDVRRFEDLSVAIVRQYRAELAARPGLRGKPIQPEMLSGSDRALRTFFRWASAEGYPVAERIVTLPKVRVPWKEPTLFLPQEAVAVQLVVGAGVRRLELCGLSLSGPDGLPDLNVDSLDRGIVELRVRGEAGAKGMRARRVPVVAKLGTEIKRYVARHRPEVEYRHLLISSEGRPYGRRGVDALMDRLTERVGFRVHAHAFRHTFATVATQLG
jgi:site-specific recombinase XerD